MHNGQNVMKNEGKKVNNVATVHGSIHKRRKKNLDENADDKITASLAITCTSNIT